MVQMFLLVLVHEKFVLVFVKFVLNFIKICLNFSIIVLDFVCHFNFKPLQITD